MKTVKIITLTTIFFWNCTSEKGNNNINNPKYSPEVEARIEQVINNLQVKTSLEGEYERETLTNQLEKYHTPGVSIAVINEGKIEWARGFGKRDLASNQPVDVNTLFEAGSVSKPIFALAVMRLKEKGMVDLDDDVNNYLKSWKVPKNGAWQPKITLRQLLSHTAGLTVHGFPGYLSSEPIPTLPQILNGDSPANTPAVKVNILPGRTFRYSGGGTTVAQLAIQDVMHKTLPAIAKEELFQPLGLPLSTFEQPLPSKLGKFASTAYPRKNLPIKGRFHTYPEMAAAGLWTNPTELANVVIEVQNSLKGQSQLFKKKTIEEMLTPQKVAKQIGIGFFLKGKGDAKRFGHSGWDEGFVAKVTAYKNLGVGAVVMVNSNDGFPIMDEIIRSIAIEYNWTDYSSPSREFVTSNGNIKAHVGLYSMDASKIQIDVKGDFLTLQYEDQDPILLKETTEGGYRNDKLNFQVTFKENKLKISQNGKSYNYKKEITQNKK
jgi:CubicO group peptidase (beta-lactamase class C family)